ncbi:MAG TPA: hypothetical protein VF183_10395 [Acidimicrobiales bacterium]
MPNLRSPLTIGSHRPVIGVRWVRAGQIGPVRREIVFEPLHERPAPVEKPAPEREPQPKEPVPQPS